MYMYIYMYIIIYIYLYISRTNASLSFYHSLNPFDGFHSEVPLPDVVSARVDHLP